MNKPLIAVTMGDPAGIGPEIVVKAIGDGGVLAAADCVVVGDSRVLAAEMARRKSPLRLRTLDDPARGDYGGDTLNLIDLANVDMDDLEPGRVCGMCGRASFGYVEAAIALAKGGGVSAVATAPINKESLKAGGIDYIGHTEMFGGLTGTRDPLTMFEVRGMRVFFLTRHVSLRRACDLVTRDRIVDYVKRCKEALARLGVADGTMAVAGLNPHSSEHGLFGDEEVRHVSPAVEELLAAGYDVAGPVPPDSVFHMALGGRFQAVLSLYHDQGHIATKTLDFERTVAVTNGMPILRTSVDHGTALDIAGKGIASPVSMIEAILVAAKYAPCFVK